MGYAAVAGLYGANPAEFFLLFTGNSALYLYLSTIYISPLGILPGMKKPAGLLKKQRKLLGIASFVYACLHGIIYTLDNLEVLNSNLLKPFVMIGLSAFGILLILTVTSFRVITSRITPRQWKYIHRLTYIVPLLLVLHITAKDKGNPERAALLFTPLLVLELARLILYIRKEYKRRQEETIAEVNGTRLKLTDFSNYIKLFRMDHPEIADLTTFPKDLYARMADQFVNQHLLLQEASRRSVQVDGDAFKIFANTLSAGYPEEEFDGLLKSLALTQEEWNKYARDMYLISNLVKNEVENRIIISDSDIKEYISEHPDILKIPAQYELQQILVQESALAELILKDLRRGASFSEYVYKYSISPDKVNEGNMGLISLGLLPEDIEKAVFALKKPDEMTPIIKSNLGYHIFKLISVAPGKTLTEKDVKDKQTVMSLNVVLIGMMGAGKTSIGRIIADMLGYRFADTDTLIEQEQGCSEPFFREQEKKIISKLISVKMTVVASGGGIVITPGNMEILKQIGRVYYLNATPELICERISNSNNRPILNQATNKLEEIKRLHKERDALYRQADSIIDITDCAGFEKIFPMTLHEELIYRGFIDRLTSDALKEKLNRGRLTYYIGFDPTADSFHIGQLALFNLMRIMSDAGHKTIALMGGATGMIGDPSGRTKERTLRSIEDIEKSITKLEKQFRRFLDFSGGKTIILNNHDWLGKISFLHALRDIGKNFSVSEMLKRESVSSRLHGEGITYTEFSYMVLQAYDFAHLSIHHDCDLQIGGSDQWGNIVSGIDLTRRLSGKEIFGMTMPLITKSDGTKFGKSAAGTVWLDPELTSPFSLYQFFIRQADADVIRFLKIYTRLTPQQIGTLEKSLQETPHLREAQKALAEEVTRFVHGEDVLAKIQYASDAVYTKDITKLSGEVIGEVLSDIPSWAVPIQEIRTGINIVDLSVSSGLLKSKSEARRLIEAFRCDCGQIYTAEVGQKKLYVVVLLKEGKVLYRIKGFYYVKSGADIYECHLKRSLFVKNDEKPDPVPGDRVTLDYRNSDTAPLITEIHARRNILRRRKPYTHECLSIAANIDLLLIVAPLAQPEYHFDFVLRLLAEAAAHAVEPVVVLTKADLVSAEKVDLHRQLLEKSGARVFLTSTDQSDRGTVKLKAYIYKRVSVLCGVSGAGKSSLVNALFSDMSVKTGEVNVRLNQGRHTTSVATLYEPEPGYEIIDSPGVRSFEFWETDRQTLKDYCPGIRDYNRGCKMRNCLHVSEQNCAVKNARDAGQIPGEYYNTYLNILHTL
ncbi:hypothetical protein CHS0354_030083 [Potamilus streckersoni]|uniref:Tyrosine--tRNA ligase n=1 Tax=Potamilus streckersoni TaxID=2493646 RepID=A0AAE0RLR4_9BIVA|nr:hypothetical protein CHS0354_030083 [Potamilus streckersoni]